MNVASLILAGGASRRMGTPKALLLYGGETFLDRLIRIFNETCNSVTVVLGHDQSIQHRIKRAAEAKFVTNPDYEKGQLTSLQCGLKAIPASADAVIFTPVDYPAIEVSTIQALIAALLLGNTQQAPPNTQQAPPNTQQVPPNTQQVPPNTQQAPHNAQQVPPNTQQVPPNAQQAPPNNQQVPTPSGGADALVRARPPGRALLAVPRLAGRHGHPVLFAAALIADFLALPPDAEARAVIRQNIAHTTYVDVDDPAILKDIDDPQAYADLLAATK